MGRHLQHQNLIPKNNNIPDLAIPRGNVIGEYNNPDLFPGMFPTLYPTGISGFDAPDRETLISFRSQVESYFDLSDHSFHYHRSFMFVALNIYQRRTAHLHNSFTVKKITFYRNGKAFCSFDSRHYKFSC